MNAKACKALRKAVKRFGNVKVIHNEATYEVSNGGQKLAGTSPKGLYRRAKLAFKGRIRRSSTGFFHGRLKDAIYDGFNGAGP
jgi:hypothetical protein